MTDQNERTDDPGVRGSHDEDDRDRADHLLADLGEDRPAAHAPPALEDDLARLFDLSREILASLDFDALLPRILDVALEISGAERGILFYFDPATGEQSAWAIRGASPEQVTEAASYSRTVLDDVKNRRTVLSDDAREDPRYRDASSVSLQQIRSVLCLPLANDQRVFGALYLDNRSSDRRFSERVVRLIGVLAGLSALATQNAERFRELSRQNRDLIVELGRLTRFDEIVGRSRAMQEVLKDLELVAATDFPVMILGESGTGKEMIARALHRSSRRAAGPFVAQNCAAIPTELLESEFFGHTRGAFTGAHVAREGLFRMASGGTLFLDEIADLDIRLQAKLLRVLEEGTVRPIGSTQEERVDFRLISATSTDMVKALKEGRMRRDLYYRLNVMTLSLPPLRERTGDVPLLLEHFVQKHREAAGGKEVRFTAETIDQLQKRSWPGNIRELEHFVKRILVLSQSTVIEAGDVARYLEGTADAEPQIRIPIGQMSLGEIETWAIEEAMRRTGGNKARAAKLLGIHRNALLRKLQKRDGSDMESESPPESF